MVAVLDVIVFFVFIVPRLLGLIPLPQSGNFWAYFFLLNVVTGITATCYAADWPSSLFNTV